MINKIRIQNCFRHPDTTIDFKEGLTGIFGANEAGKSLIFEMIAYALFGSVALRGSAADYKKLIITMDFTVSGTSYNVYRAGTKAILKRTGNELATGQKPINAEIIRILGYDYKVYCVANYSPQGELCNLSRMKPAERKAMVDNVIGLGIIDKIIVSIADQMRELNGKITGMDANLVEPEEPVKPENYRPQLEINKDLDEKKLLLNKFNYMDTWLRQPQKTLPVKPEVPSAPNREEISKEQALVAEKNSRLREVNAKLSGYVPATVPADQLQALKEDWIKIHRRNEVNALMTRFIKESIYTKKQLDAFKKQAEDAQKWKLKLQLEAHGKNHCPNCQHEWFLQADQLAKYADAVETAMPIYVPNDQDYVNILTYEEQKVDRLKLEKELEKLNKVELPIVSQSVIDQQLQGIERQQEMEQLRIEQNKLQQELQIPHPNYEDLLRLWNNYDNQIASYQANLTAYNTWLTDYQNNYKIWEELSTVPSQVAVLQQELQAAILFDYSWNSYLTAKEKWEVQAKAVGELRFELADMDKAREAMRGLRISVKKFLVPSLNKVASHLLSQMTGGSRNIIDINEEFEIMVDGQAIATLSGSGQAVSNLAIRIALGQVLIAKKFSVFLADEIDGDMDEERAGFTAECLRRITKHVSQFLLISHKRPLADNYIELGAS